MDLKKKAGLALALAAIFTTGWATVALAEDNVTPAGNGDIEGGDGTGTLNLGTVTDLNLTGDVDVQNINATVAGEDAVTITGTGSEVITINGQSGEIAANSADGKPLDVTITDATIVLDGAGSMAGTLTLVGSAPDQGKAEVTGDYTLAAVEANADSLITVGEATADGLGTLVIGTANLGGATIFADPLFDTSEGLNPSTVAINAWDNGAPSDAGEEYINGILVGGRNSAFTIGIDNSDFVNRAILDTDKWITLVPAGQPGYTAAMAFIGPQKLDKATGGLFVSGGTGLAGGTPATSGSGTPNTIDFGNNSLIAFDLTGVSDTVAALSSWDLTTTPDTQSTTTINIGAAGAAGTTDAGVYFHNAHADGIYLIVEAATITVDGAGDGNLLVPITDTTTQGSWINDDMHFSSGLLDGVWTKVANTGPGGNDLILTVSRNDTDVREIFPDLSSGMAGLVNELYTAGDNNVFYDRAADTDTYGNNGSRAGIAFVSRLTDAEFINPKDGARGLESAAQIAVAAGVPAITNNVISKIGGLIVDHNNLLNDTQPAYGNEPGQLGLWLNPFYGYSDVDGLEAGSFENGYEINYGGAAFGIDYNVNEAFRLGLALNAGGGDSESQGTLNKAENDFDFFGVSLYGSYSNGAFGLTGDLGYTTVDNDAEMRMPAIGMGGKIHSSMDSDAFTIGLTGQYRFSAGENLNVTPHLGLRYTKVSTDDADLKLGGLTFFEVETEDQNLFQIPLGVEFSSDIVTDGGWTVTPSADLGVLFTMGDTDVDSLARISGVGGKWRTNSDVMDSAAFMGSLGIKAKADNGLSLGLDYGILASGDQTDHQFSGMLRFEF